MKSYRIEFELVNDSKDIRKKGHNAISFTNRGTDTAYINNEELPAGETLSINGLEGETDTTKYTVKWLSAATSKNVKVKQKFYN